MEKNGFTPIAARDEEDGGIPNLGLAATAAGVLAGIPARGPILTAAADSRQHGEMLLMA